MATDLQHKALEKVVEYGRAGKRISKGKLLKEVGYAGTTAIAPQKVFESKGFLELCEQNGLTDDMLTKALVDDIKAKPKRRFKELELGFKVRSRLTPESNSVNNNVLIIQLSDKSAQRYGTNEIPSGDSNRSPQIQGN